MREFSLKNAKGQVWDLNATKSFGSQIKGLGQEHKVDYEQIGNVFIKTENLLKQKSPSGNVVFEDYVEFEAFSKFIMFKPLTLRYLSENEYFMDVSIDKLTKTELEYMGLECDILFKGLTTFYRMVTASKSKADVGKKYDYNYPYSYVNNVAGQIEFQVDTTLDCPVKLTFFGPCKNPSWKHFVNGVLDTEGKINVDVEEGKRLIINTISVPFSIVETDNLGKEIMNHYQKSDFSTKRFLYLKHGENKITFTHEGNSDIKMLAEGRLEYESI